LAKRRALGKLIALDGNGPELVSAGRQLLRSETGGAPGGTSKWDASNIFYELRMAGRGLPAPSPRTLLLLYASDLAFRLRWEIRPALEEGLDVVAAPYVETAIALGRATGLPRRWLTELFAFAPKPARSYYLRGPTQAAWMGKRSAGFLEFCLVTLASNWEQWDELDLRRKVSGYLNGLERRGLCRSASGQAPARSDGQ